MTERSDWFRRFLLPGLAFKAVVIGGGYATGRELVTYFMAGGPIGGIYAMVVATIIWSMLCAVTFLLAWRLKSYDYRTFFKRLLGPAWPLFELAYVLALMVTLAVFAAAAGAIGQAVFGWPALVGSLILVISITAVATFGNRVVEALFKYVSFFLYATYAIFLILALTRFGDRIGSGIAHSPPAGDWLFGGLAYAIYNGVGAVAILPVLRHMRNGRDAVVAGVLAGPLAMIPAALFFVAMIGFYPVITKQLLPSDYLLTRLDAPTFRLLFQLMIFAALLESGVGGVHAINERIAGAMAAKRREFTRTSRFLVATSLLGFSVFIATSIGLVALIAEGYRLIAYAFLIVFVIPVLTRGVWMVTTRREWSVRPVRRTSVPIKGAN